MADSFWATFWVAASAIATFLVALIAIFGQAFRDKFWPPLLSLELASEKGELTNGTLVSPPNDYDERPKRSVPARYYHLRVHNQRRWSKATDLQVILARVEERGVDGYDTTWTGAIPFGWRHQVIYGPSRTIGAHGDVDLCSVYKDKFLWLHLQIEPNNLEVRRRTATSLILHVQARAIEGDSAPILVKIAWDGQWEDGETEMQRHLKVEILPPPVAH